MIRFEILSPSVHARLPFIVHVPHSSTNVPADYRADFVVSADELDAELLAMTDRYTDELAEAATELGGTVLVNRVSRLVMDPERFADDDAEPMAARGMGAVYLSRRDGQALRRADFSSDDRRRIMADLYEPYHRALEHLASEMLDDFDRCLLVDLHSFPRSALPYEDATLARPDLCIGFDDAHGDDVLRDRWSALARARGLEVGFNTPFVGSLVPTRFYQRDARVRSLMIELRRDHYMDERTGERSPGFAESVALITSLLASAANRSKEDCRMLDKNPNDIANLESRYPGITETIRAFQAAELPPCPACGSVDTAKVICGVIGRTMRIVGATRKPKLIANGPAPGAHFCHACDAFF
jgi:N-formylglutamate deformylase